MDALGLSGIGLGTAPLGGLYSRVSDDDARDVILTAWAAGIRYFDTAPLYGRGSAERRLGNALSEFPRAEMLVSSKVGRVLETNEGSGKGDVEVRFDFSADGVRRSIDESLERLQMEYLDIVYVHDPDAHITQALDETFPALLELREQGVVKAIGAGMNQTEALVTFARETDPDLFLLGGRYTLLDQGAIEELFPICLERQIGVIAGGVYNSGILANPSVGARYDYRAADPAILERALRLDEACRAYDVDLKAAAIQFPMAHPAVLAVLLGPRSVDELQDNLSLSAQPIPDALWRSLTGAGLIDDRAALPGAARP